MLLLPFNNSLVASSIFIIENNRRFFFSFPGSAWECLNPRLCLAEIGRQSLWICVPRQSLKTRGSEALPRRNREAEPPDLRC